MWENLWDEKKQKLFIKKLNQKVSLLVNWINI